MQLIDLTLEGKKYTLIRFTPTELRILEGLSKAGSNKEIAHRAGLAEPTIKGYISRFMAVLRLSNRTEIAHWVWERAQFLDKDWWQVSPPLNMESRSIDQAA